MHAQVKTFSRKIFTNDIETLTFDSDLNLLQMVSSLSIYIYSPCLKYTEKSRTKFMHLIFIVEGFVHLIIFESNISTLFGYFFCWLYLRPK